MKKYEVLHEIEHYKAMLSSDNSIKYVKTYLENHPYLDDSLDDYELMLDIYEAGADYGDASMFEEHSIIIDIIHLFSI